MTYLSGKTQKKNNYVVYSVLAVVFLLVVIFWPMIKTKSYTVLEPVVMKFGMTKDSFSVFPEFFSTYLTSHNTLVAENRKLEVAIEQLENTLAEKDALLREHDLESTSLGTSTPQKMTPLVLYPIMQDITKIYSSVLLSKGFKDGVDIGDIVYLRGNQAVCTIKEVYNSSALCLLLSSSGVITEGVTSSSSINVTLVGRGGHYLANITRDTPISVGEKVYLRSNPKMVLGVVKAVSNNDQDTSWHAFVEGAYNPVTSAIFYVQP
jgi:cell shape-determining protein MreC